MLFVIHLENFFIPAIATITAFSLLLGRRTIPIRFTRTAYAQAKPIGGGDWRLAVEHEGGQADREVFGDLIASVYPIGDN